MLFRSTGATAKGTVTCKPACTGHFVVGLDDLKTGIELRDKHMKEKYLETPKWKDAFFDLDAWTPTDKASQFGGKRRPGILQGLGGAGGQQQHLRTGGCRSGRWATPCV